MNMALLIIDMQKATYKYHHRESMDIACKCINRTINVFRKNNKKIIWIQHVNKDEVVVPGTEGFEIIDTLKPLDVETLNRKISRMKA